MIGPQIRGREGTLSDDEKKAKVAAEAKGGFIEGVRKTSGCCGQTSTGGGCCGLGEEAAECGSSCCGTDRPSDSPKVACCGPEGCCS